MAIFFIVTRRSGRRSLIDKLIYILFSTQGYKAIDESLPLSASTPNSAEGTRTDV